MFYDFADLWRDLQWFFFGLGVIKYCYGILIVWLICETLIKVAQILSNKSKGEKVNADKRD